MKSVLEVCGLEKTYPAFSLKEISFDLEPGRITGFIGRNGAGKTTTLKCLLGLLHRDSGEIRYWGRPFSGNENWVKQRLGFISGGIGFYPAKKLRTITRVTRRFYENWDENAYEDCIRRFELDEEKSPNQLSQGMKVKYALTLALSHGATLLILDEPTSGLDPVSRDALLELFLDLRDRGVTILFSTHITADLQRCADNLIYIQQGRILARDSLAAFVAGYRRICLPQCPADPAQSGLLGLRRERDGVSALIAATDAVRFPEARETDLENIMVYLEREAQR